MREVRSPSVGSGLVEALTIRWPCVYLGFRDISTVQAPPWESHVTCEVAVTERV